MYDIKYGNLMKQIGLYMLVILLCIVMVVVFLIMDSVGGTEEGSSGWIIAVMLFMGIFIVLALFGAVKPITRIKVIKELNRTGMLVKGLPYRLEKTGAEANGKQILRIVVDYTLPSGVVIPLYGDWIMDGKLCDADGLVDVVIDPYDSNKYFIDLEINRKA